MLVCNATEHEDTMCKAASGAEKVNAFRMHLFLHMVGKTLYPNLSLMADEAIR